MRPTVYRRCCSLTLVLTVLALPSPAQDTPAGTFGGSVEVRVVNVEAVVTDRSGDRVVGLGPDAFRLVVDGKPVPIDYFSEIRDGTLAAPPDAETAPGPPPALGGSAAREAAGTSYLVFVDEYFPLQTDRNRALAFAAYNAGEKAVNRWLARRGHLPLDVFIEEIPFAETNRYVRKLLSFHSIYYTLSHGKPPPGPPFSFSKKALTHAQKSVAARKKLRRP